MGSGTDIGSNTLCDLGQGWKDPRTGLCFINESVARSLGYGQPVNTANTIVQVGSQGSFTADHRLVTAEMLADPAFIAGGANNAGYVNAAAVNLQQQPTSDAQSAYNGLVNYLHTGSFTDPQAAYVRPVAAVATPTSAGNLGAGTQIAPQAISGSGETTAASGAIGMNTAQSEDVTPADNPVAKYGGMAIAAIIVIIGLFLIATGFKKAVPG